jgi:site-specific recombinase XerD
LTTINNQLLAFLLNTFQVGGRRFESALPLHKAKIGQKAVDIVDNNNSRPPALLEIMPAKLLVEHLLLSIAIKYFMDAKKAEQVTRQTISGYTERLASFCKTAGDIELTDIDAMVIRSHLVALQERDLSTYTVHAHFRVLRTFFKWAVKEGFLLNYPMQNIKAPRLDRKIIPTFTGTDIQKLLDACPNNTFRGVRNQALILVMLDTLARAGEMVQMQVNDVDYDNGVIKVHGKGRKERLVHFGNVTRKVMWRYLILRDVRGKDQKYLWLSEEATPLTRMGLTTIIKKLAFKVGLKGERRSPHTLRHTGAVLFLRNGGDIFTLKTLLGHSSLNTTMEYLKTLGPEDAVKAHEKFSPVDRLSLK